MKVKAVLYRSTNQDNQYSVAIFPTWDEMEDQRRKFDSDAEYIAQDIELNVKMVDGKAVLVDSISVYEQLPKAECKLNHEGWQPSMG